MKIIGVYAKDSNYGIGYNNNLPWINDTDPDIIQARKIDMKHFKDTTTDSIVVMGSKTFDSINCKPLPNRINIVVTNSASAVDIDNILYFVNNPIKAITLAQIYNKNLYVIGGGQIYNWFDERSLYDELYVTTFNKKYKCDRFFNHSILIKKPTIIYSDPMITIEHYT